MRKQHEFLFEICRNLKSSIFQDEKQLDEIKKSAREQNSWFDSREIDRMLELISINYLDELKLSKWLATYEFKDFNLNKRVGIVAAGNIPLASFQDVWCVLACRYQLQLKLSSKDQVISKYVYDKINLLIPEAHSKIQYVERVSNIDALITSGSNLTANHFAQFKDRFPCLVRAHRNGIAILSGNETDEEIIQLGIDVFSFYGLGCRNVTKVYIPDRSMIIRMAKLFDAHFPYVRNSHKYNNNYEYQMAILSLNRAVFMQSDTILFNESKSIHSAIAVVNYEIYISLTDLLSEVEQNIHSIQCTCTNIENITLKTSKLGKAQWPELWDYQDDIDVIQFLQKSLE